MLASKPKNYLLSLIILSAIIWGGSQPLLGGGPVLAQGFSCTSVTSIPQAECEALLVLYQSTQGESWQRNRRAGQGERCGENPISWLFGRQ